MEGPGAEGVEGKIGKIACFVEMGTTHPRGMHHLPAKVSKLGGIEN